MNGKRHFRLPTLKTRLKYAFSDDQETYGHEEIEKESHVTLARIAAEKSMVLIKNNEVLPLPAETGQKVVVLGRLANMENTGDHASSNSCQSYMRFFLYLFVSISFLIITKGIFETGF